MAVLSSYHYLQIAISYDEEEELDALDTVVVDPLTASSSSGPTLNWGWGQPVRTQTRENTHIQNRLRRESHMMGM
jgi:hypothetical protein